MVSKGALLLVEDDEVLGQLLTDYLGLNGFRVQWARTGGEALHALEAGRPDLTILDIMLPDMDGFEILKILRQKYPQAPALFLTARSLMEDQKTGFRLGADDYIIKPFDSELLLLKIKAVLTRARMPEKSPMEELIRFSRSVLDTRQRLLQCGQRQFQLSPRENDLLTFLARRPNQLCRRSEILQQLWGDTSPQAARSMDVYISRLRKYLAQDPEISLYNIHNEGYVLRTGSLPI